MDFFSIKCYYLLVVLASYDHIFPNVHYQDIEKYKLENPRMFHYLNQSDCYDLDGVDDSKEYLATRRAMDVVGINADDQVLYLIE